MLRRAAAALLSLEGYLITSPVVCVPVSRAVVRDSDPVQSPQLVVLGPSSVSPHRMRFQPSSGVVPILAESVPVTLVSAPQPHYAPSTGFNMLRCDRAPLPSNSHVPNSEATWRMALHRVSSATTAAAATSHVHPPSPLPIFVADPAAKAQSRASWAADPAPRRGLPEPSEEDPDADPEAKTKPSRVRRLRALLALAKRAARTIVASLPVRPTARLVTVDKAAQLVAGSMADRPRSSSGVIVETKHDGVRVVIIKRGHAVVTAHRSSGVLVRPGLAKAVAVLVRHAVPACRRCVLEGELIKSTPQVSKTMDSSGTWRACSNPEERGGLLRRVSLVLFDVLVLGNTATSHFPLLERRAALKRAVKKPIAGRIGVSRGTVLPFGTPFCAVRTLLRDTMQTTARDGHEGLVVKPLDHRYALVGSSAENEHDHEGHPPRLSWLKVKRLADSVDAVVLGAWFGEGRNSGVLSRFLIGVRTGGDGSTPWRFVPIGVVHHGLSNAARRRLTVRYTAPGSAHRMRRYRSRRNGFTQPETVALRWGGAAPDVCIRDVAFADVWEIRGYCPRPGSFLRSAKFVRSRHKTAAEATLLSEVTAIGESFRRSR